MFFLLGYVAKVSARPDKRHLIVSNRKGDATVVSISSFRMTPFDPKVVHEERTKEDCGWVNEEARVVPYASPCAKIIEQEVFNEVSKEVSNAAARELVKCSRIVAVEVFLYKCDSVEEKNSIRAQEEDL